MADKTLLSKTTKVSDKIRLDQSIRISGGMIMATREITQALQQRFDALGGAAFFGAQVRKDGRAWTYQNGSLIYHPQRKQVFEVHGDIHRKWQALGGLRWGVPCTDELPTANNDGRFNHFNDEGATIFWTPGTGAQAVWGDILKRWKETGWERGYLGYPTSDEVDFPDGGRANSFQHGGIYWWPDTGAIDLRDVVVHYTGLFCYAESDWDQSSNSDEPYLIFSVAAPRGVWTHKTRVYSDVDKGEARPDLMEIYRGPPHGLALSVTCMEHDEGDPDKYRQKIQDAATQVHQAGTAALTLIPVVGPIVAAVAGPLLGALIPRIGGAVSDALNLGDDRIASVGMVVSARDMVILAARQGTRSYRGIGYKKVGPMMAGAGARYQAFLGIVPA